MTTGPDGRDRVDTPPGGGVPGGVPGDATPDPTTLAELDAGLPGAAADPRAAAVLDALAATRAELAALPTPEVPPAVAARWAAALAAESATSAGRPDGRERTAGRRRPGARGRRAGPRRPRVLAAAVAAAVAGTGFGAFAARPDPAPPAVTRVELVALGRAAVGTMDVGGLADPARRTACLHAVVSAAAGETLLGGRRVVLDGRPGVLLVLATGTRGGLRIVTVDPGCGPDGGVLQAQLLVG